MPPSWRSFGAASMFAPLPRPSPISGCRPACCVWGRPCKKRWAALLSSPLPAGMAPQWMQTDPQRRPLYAAGAATALVALGGLLLARPWAQAETVRTYPVASAAAPPPMSVSRSAFGAGPQTASVPPPMVLMPPRANLTAPAGIPPGITTRDPFAGHIPAPYSASGAAPAGAGSPLWTLPAVPRPASRRTSDQSPPPLRLAALPPVGSGGVAPAPVTLPPGAAPVPAARRATPVPAASYGFGRQLEFCTGRICRPVFFRAVFFRLVFAYPYHGASSAGRRRAERLACCRQRPG